MRPTIAHYFCIVYILLIRPGQAVHIKAGSMWVFLLVIAIIGTIFLFIHLNLELNSLNKKTDTLIKEIKKHYGIE